MHNHSYENKFNLHVNEISFSYERMSTQTRFEKEAKGNSEMAYCGAALEPNSFSALDTLIFRPEPKISLSPETHEYLEKVITLAEINLRQNKNL